jgi:hypothetical protein
MGRTHEDPGQTVRGLVALRGAARSCIAVVIPPGNQTTAPDRKQTGRPFGAVQDGTFFLIIVFREFVLARWTPCLRVDGWSQMPVRAVRQRMRRHPLPPLLSADMEVGVPGLTWSYRLPARWPTTQY